MAKIYVASNEVSRAKKVMEELIAAGHTITFDWTIDIEKQEDKPAKALMEREAVRECDVLVYLWKDNQESARMEVGMAMGLRKRVVAVTDHQAWFFTLPEVIQVDSDDQIISAINISMEKKSKLKHFAYRYDKGAGPLSLEDLKKEDFTEGNCRLAVQYYFYKDKGLFLDSTKILLPEAYKNVGAFIFKEADIDYNKLKKGDVVYAENLKNKNNKILNRNRSQFKDEDEWILYFHSAIFLGQLDDDLVRLLPEGDYPKNTDLIWHSSIIDGGSCVWPLDKFQEYYKPVSVKRLV